MRHLMLVLISSLIFCVFQQCRTVKHTPPAAAKTAVLASEGFITCFEPGLADGKLWCEASAVINQQGRIFLANDKDMPSPRSSVFYFPTIGDIIGTAANPRPATYLNVPTLQAAHKFEEFAQSPNRKWTFLTTAFDRIKPDTSEWDGYNTLLAWQPGREGAVQVVGADGTGKASLSLRKQLQAALGGSPYFKVEGLAATDTHLYFGVREQGERFDKFDYRISVLSAPYRASRADNADETITLGAVTPVRTFKVDDVDPVLPKPLAISSLEYDSVRHCFWLMTSYEQAGQIGAYLWTITEAAMAANGDLQLVRTTGNKPLAFTHKAEDMTFLDANTLLIIHDDDRLKTHVGTQDRQPNQAAYSVVRIGQ